LAFDATNAFLNSLLSLIKISIQSSLIIAFFYSNALSENKNLDQAEYDFSFKDMSRAAIG
jgi:hypothetical protein